MNGAGTVLRDRPAPFLVPALSPTGYVRETARRTESRRRKSGRFSSARGGATVEGVPADIPGATRTDHRPPAIRIVMRFLGPVGADAVRSGYAAVTGSGWEVPGEH